jgi:hypothetical protein
MFAWRDLGYHRSGFVLESRRELCDQFGIILGQREFYKFAESALGMGEKICKYYLDLAMERKPVPAPHPKKKAKTVVGRSTLCS